MANYSGLGPPRGVELIFYASLVSKSDTTIFEVNPTISAGDFKISKDGGAFANLSTLPVVTPANGVSVKVTLSATEMTADNVFVVASSTNWVSQSWCIQPGISIDTLIDNLLDEVNTSAQHDVTDSVGKMIRIASEIDPPTADEIAQWLLDVDNSAASHNLTDSVGKMIRIASEIMDEVNGIEVGSTLRQAIRLIAATTGAKLSGAGTGTEVFRNAVADSKNRVIATVDNMGNRTAIAYDLT